MDAAEYRQQFEAELAQAAAARPKGRGRATPARDHATAVGVLQDGGADAATRSAALDQLGGDVDRAPQAIAAMLGVVRDTAVPSAQRIEVLKALQQLVLRAVLFPGIRPDYLETMRGLMDDPDIKVRRLAVGILAREKDDQVQQRLTDGLEGRAPALVPAAKAVQFLGYDLHAEHFPLLRRIVESPPNQAARKEAIRLLAADPDAAGLLEAILRDRTEGSDVRRIAAVSLQGLAPDRFAEQAREIAIDATEDEQLRALCLSALSLFTDRATTDQDGAIARSVELLAGEPVSRELKQAAAGYLAPDGR